MKRGTGLFWQITDPKQKLADAITEAMARFKKKYGTSPTEIILNEDEMQAAGIKETSFKISGSRQISPRHIHVWGVPNDDNIQMPEL